MTDLQLPLSVNEASRPAYEVRVNDGGPDGGTTSLLYVGGFPGSFTTGDLDDAVQAFADSLGSVAGFTVTGITRINVSETAL